MFSRLTSNPAMGNTGHIRGMIRHLHFVGIGGVGMSGIAEVFCNLGFSVSGSDLWENPAVQRLAGMGVKIYIGHDAANVVNADVVVMSSAVTADNPEIEEARKRRIPVVPRAEMLSELMRFRFGIAIAGTHGKTTTTSLVASILHTAGLDPTFVIGGKLNSAGTNARLGEGQYFVAEADESDASFLFLKPMIAVVTNIDADHMSTYGDDFERLRHTFLEFLQHLPFYGLAVLCFDDPEVRSILGEVTRPVLTYGLTPGADIVATDIRQQGMQSSFKVQLPERKDTLSINLNMPGVHNVQNALAAIAIAWQLDVDDKAIVSALAAFDGIGRRFQIYGDFRVADKQFMLVDDYGHHPKEVAATLAAARAGWPGRRLLVVFQPHRFSRTRDLFDDFVKELAEPERVIVMDVYPAGEQPVAGADSRSLTRAIRTLHRNEPLHEKDVEGVIGLLPDLIEDGDIVIALGAGNIGNLAPLIAQRSDVFVPCGQETGTVS